MLSTAPDTAIAAGDKSACNNMKDPDVSNINNILWNISDTDLLSNLQSRVRDAFNRWGEGPPAAHRILIEDSTAEYEGQNSEPFKAAVEDDIFIIHRIPESDEQLWQQIMFGFFNLASGSETTLVPLSELSARELEVLALVAVGEPNKAIAFTLGISLGTVKFHIHNILEKLECQNRAEMVFEAARLGLITV